MISRRSTLFLARLFQEWFSRNERVQSSGYSSTPTWRSVPKLTEMYDFLYEHNFPAYLCNSVRSFHSARQVQDWILQLHTGESLVGATKGWEWSQREKLGNRHLRDLAECLLAGFERADPATQAYRGSHAPDLRAALELDGYRFSGGKLLEPEAEVLNVEQERGVLHDLYAETKLPGSDAAFRFLELSEEHYIAERWEDAIANARKFLEVTLLHIADAHAAAHGAPLAEKTREKPVEIRLYLERAGYLESKEAEAVAKVYGLLSHTGSHPYMAQRDQARLLRQMTLTLSQFALLRYRGSLPA